MPRRATASSSLAQLVRRYFGLHQFELAAYLGLTRGLVGHLEAGRRGMSAPVAGRLAALATYLAPAEATPPDPAAHLAPPDAAPLQARLADCRHHAAKLRRELATLTARLEVARRWQAALPGLLADADERARPWLRRRQEAAAADLDGETAARYHLLRLRAEALEAEAAGLAALLGPASRAPAMLS